MTLQQLRIFIAVAEREHVTTAARSLNLTQSAVSAAIVALESHHSVTLFSRVGKHIELTDAGRVFLDEARAVLARARAAELALSELGGAERGTLSIHASQTIASYWLPQRLVRFRDAHPRIKINLVAGNTTQVAKAVTLGTADIGFVEGRVDAENLLQQVIARDRLIAVVNETHPLATRKRITSEDLLSAEWVMREPGSGTRSEFEETLKSWKLSVDRLNVVLELPSNEAVRMAVEAGAGATVISELVATTGIKSGKLKALAMEFPQRAFTVLRHQERYCSKATEIFLSEIKEAMMRSAGTRQTAQSSNQRQPRSRRAMSASSHPRDIG
jgi:DNA-binding transcriptional LysR family regulator